jgi:hypothetical protein
MEKTTKVFVALMVLLIVGSFVALVIAHILAINKGAYSESIASQETIFIAALALAVAIVVILPMIITNEQIERKINNYWKDNYQKKINQFMSKSEMDYAHVSRMIAHLLMLKTDYYWAMGWASDSIIAYINRFKAYPDDYRLNKEYIEHSLNIMEKSLKARMGSVSIKDDTNLNENIIRKIYNGEKITEDEKKKKAVDEFIWLIYRCIEWQSTIYVKIKEEPSYDAEELVENHLVPDYRNEFEDMVNKAFKSFCVDKKQFIEKVVEKIESEEERKKVREHLKDMLKNA